MSVRVAVIGDLASMVVMGRRFLASTAYKDRIADDAAHVASVAQMVLDTGYAAVAEHDGHVVGMIWALVFVHPLLNVPIGTEVIWWVEPVARGSPAGRLLFQAAEAWAASRGAVKMQFTAFRDPRLERVYQRYGYTSMEAVFEKDLS